MRRLLGSLATFIVLMYAVITFSPGVPGSVELLLFSIVACGLALLARVFHD